MNKWIIITSIYLLTNCPIVALSGELYSPDGCDFTVEFPDKYQIKTLYLESEKTVLQASLKTKDGSRLMAECYTSSITKDEFIVSMVQELKKRGVTVFNAQAGSQRGIDNVVISGTLDIADTKIFTKNISYFGDYSRLDLIQVEREISSKDSLNFRNSVRMKQRRN